MVSFGFSLLDRTVISISHRNRVTAMGEFTSTHFSSINSSFVFGGYCVLVFLFFSLVEI
jgi:hypothetical protein